MGRGGIDSTRTENIMENAITIINCNELTFKHPGLVRATKGLAKCFTAETQSRKEACKILATVERDKLYKEDGFKSLAEYAARIGLDKSLAHKMENAGRAFLSENEAVRKFAEQADYSKLSLLASEKEEDVAEAITKGELTANSSSADVKAWKQAKRPSKPQTVKKYHIRGYIYTGNGVKEIDEPNEAPELYELFKPFTFGKVKIDEETVYLGFNPETCEVCRYTLSAAVTPGDKRKMDMNEISKQVSVMTPEQLQALLDSINGMMGSKEE